MLGFSCTLRHNEMGIMGHPHEFAEDHVSHILTHLAVKEHASAPTHNQALSTILFLYDNVLRRPLDRIVGVIHIRKPKRLPTELTPDEIRQISASAARDDIRNRIRKINQR